MPIIKLQSEIEKRNHICYQFDSDKSPIGEGGMGKVYEGVCIDERTGSTRPVAIKFMYDDLPESAYERARREAEIQLRNDNLVEMLGFIEIQEERLGLVTKHYHVVSELLTGVSLSDILNGKTKDRDGEDVPYAVKLLQDYKNDPEHFAQIIVMNVLSGLMALHDAGYIHRDIDPSNIMVTSNGHIKLIDFGIAKQMNSLTTGDRSLTVAGKFMGKPEYAAPELALGDVKSQNQTTDIYAVGILLYQCILGHTPFEGPRHEILEKQLKAKLPLSKIKNKALRNIIATACQKKQNMRYQTSSQMRVALENLSGVKTQLSPQKRWLFVAAAVFVVAALSVIGYVVKDKQEQSREVAEMALVEQHRTETKSLVDNKMQEAERLMKIGMDKENDNYELQLMNSYTFYREIEAMAKHDTLSVIPLKLVQGKMSELSALLDSAQVELDRQAQSLMDMGEADMAKVYQERNQAIVEFKNKIK